MSIEMAFQASRSLVVVDLIELPITAPTTYGLATSIDYCSLGPHNPVSFCDPERPNIHSRVLKCTRWKGFEQEPMPALLRRPIRLLIHTVWV